MPNDQLQKSIAGINDTIGQVNTAASNLGYTAQLDQLPQSEPTVAETYQGYSAPGVDSAYETAMDELGSYYRDQASQPINEKQVYRDTLRQYQDQINATNKIYQDQLAQARVEGMGRLGSQRAISARSGTLGSDFGAAQKENVVGYNRGIEQSINAELNAKIAEIMGTARSQSSQELEKRRLAKQEGAESYLAYLAGKTERRQSGLSNLAQSMLAQGVTPDDIDPTVLKQIATQYGVSEDEIKASFFDANKAAQAEAAQNALDNQFTLTEGQQRYDADGNLIAAGPEKDQSFNLSEGQARYDAEGNLIASRAKTYAPKATSGVGSSVIDGGSNAYSSDLDAIIGVTLSTIPSKFGQETFQNQISRARDEADKVSLVAAQVLKGAPSEIKSDFANQSVGISQLDKAIAALDEGAKTGAIPATKQYLLNFVGQDYDPELARINQLITSAIQPYRASVTGAAWGEQEDAEYNNLFGSTRFYPEELKQRLEGVKQILADKSAQGLNAYINPLGMYDNPFETGAYSPQATDLRTQVDQAGYDYDAMVADGLSDEEISAAINGN